MDHPSSDSPAGPLVTDLRVGRRRDGAVWVDGSAPPVSWRTGTSSPGWTQAAAELTLTREGGEVERHRVHGSDSVLVAWPFTPLRSRELARLQVRTTGADGTTAAPAGVVVEVPLLEAGDWSAEWVALADAADDQPGQLRRSFTLSADPVRARLHVTALGAYEVELNGIVVGDEVLAPGWTSYRDRVLVATHDVTHLLHTGENAVGAWLAGAWFTERYGFFGRARRAYEGPAALLAQLEVDLADGTRVVVGTDADWTGSTDGPLRSSGIYAGEEFDATRHDPAWSSGGTGDRWPPVRVVPVPGVALVPTTAEPVRRTGEIAAVEVSTTPAGARVVDFGQNLVGRVRIRVQGPAGHTVTLRHAEVLEDGELATRQLRYAWSVDRYTLAGTGIEQWEPRFTFHGFRFLQVDDWPGDFDPAAVTAVVCHSDMAPTGSFSCSEPLLERLHENVVWSMRGNFLSVPTDCPQRDERLGWTGDLQVFAGAAATLYDCNAFLTSWLGDLVAEQRRSDGVVPIIVPTAMREDPEGVVAAWGDAATVVPWTLYERFGDAGLLGRQYDSMRDWVEVELAQADEEGLWSRGFQLGDWLDPRAPAHSPREGRTHPSLVASAYLFRSLGIVARSAAVLGRDDDARRYTGLADRTRRAFLATYVTPAGRMVSEGPTTYAMALTFDIATDPDLRRRLGRRLAEIVREDGYRIGTGFVGTPLVMDALCSTGQLHTASRLLLQTEAPSWLYPVTVGATTVWERWDALLPDGSVNSHEMTSFNHYALGAVVDWLYRGLAGLAAAEPGFRRLRIAPTVLPGLTSAAARLVTPYGPAEAGWTRGGDQVRVTAVVPPGSAADVVLPDGTTHVVGAGEHAWELAWTDVVPPPVRRGLDTDLADLVDDPEALALVRARVAAFDPGRARAFDGALRYEAGSTLRTALMFADPDGLAQVHTALTDLAADRTAPEETP